MDQVPRRGSKKYYAGIDAANTRAENAELDGSDNLGHPGNRRCFGQRLRDAMDMVADDFDDDGWPRPIRGR